MAALATAVGKTVINLGSNGVGIIYSLPNSNLRPGIAYLTSSGTSSFVKPARAIAAAIFIVSLIYFERVSRVALNKNGKHMTLLI